MSDEAPPLTRELGDDQPIIVTLDWEGGEVRWVTVEPDWYERVGTAGLFWQVSRAYREVHPTGTGSNWRLEISLGDVALDDLKEFGLLIAEARASDPVGSGNNEPLIVRAGHLESHWSQAGGLLRLSDPRGWLPTAMRQAVCEELTEILQPPAVPDEKQTPEVRRLLAFAGRSGK